MQEALKSTLVIRTGAYAFCFSGKTIRLIYFLSLIFILFSAYPALAQKGFNQRDKDTLLLANTLFDEERYHFSRVLYERLLERHPEEAFLLYRIGICLLYKKDEYERSLELLRRTQEKNKKAADISFYLGRACMMNYKFDEAIEHFNNYLGQKKATPGKKEFAREYIENCSNGKILIADPKVVNIQNMGSTVNSDYSEYAPAISSDESTLIFTYRGIKSTGVSLEPGVIAELDLYNEDIYISTRENGVWSMPVALDTSINSSNNDAAISLSNDGQKLFVFKSTANGLGDLYMSTLNGKRWSVPGKLTGEVNSEAWEGSCSLSPDEKILYFSSERPGGFGGKDLYMAIKQPDGSWAGVRNLGPVINTPRDDDAPFIHPDGKTLLFSSKGHNSMGGYDIFITGYQPDDTWLKPENLGYPVNTTDDDIYYVLSADAKRGYYSSGKQGGYGYQDLYTVEPALPSRRTPGLVMVHGMVTLNEKPAECAIEVSDAANRSFGSFRSNSGTGKFLVNLPRGNDFKITFKIPGYDPKEYKVSTHSLDSFIAMNVNIEFYKKFTLTLVDANGKVIGTAEQTGYRNFKFMNLPSDQALMFKLEGDDADLVTEIIIPINGLYTKIVRSADKVFRYTPLKPEEATLTAVSAEDVGLNPNDPFEALVLKHGKKTIEGIVYAVQVGAFKESANFNKKHLVPYGKVDKKVHEDEITRFTLGTYNTLLEAYRMLKKVKDAGQEDAFVIAFVNGKRTSLWMLKELK